MNKLIRLKRMLALVIVCLGAAVASGSVTQINANADADSVQTDSTENDNTEITDTESIYTDSVGTESSVVTTAPDTTTVTTETAPTTTTAPYTSGSTAETTTAVTEGSTATTNDTTASADTSSGLVSSNIDTSIYTDKLQEIAEKQAEIEAQISDADETLEDETARQQLILEEISIINEKIEVVNSYITQLEMEISTETKSAQELKYEIDDGIEQYKKRLRALYIAGDMSYTEVLLNSADFYDVLMRTELVKRVADYDNKILDDLVAKKAEYDEKTEQLEIEQSALDEQSASLESERAELAELYNSSEETKQLLNEQKEQLAAEQEAMENEIYSYEGILGDLLKGTYSGSGDETTRLQTELAATEAISSLQSAIREREQAGETISDEECKYDFKWPVPGHYYVSSGVGERWGTYHKGLDITGESGVTVVASEAGEVVRVNNSCTHNYGKSSSCGCGGGYGNFVIIDHGNGFLTLYGHLTQATVEVGQTVKQGEQIGTMGTTGYSTGTHTHFELRYNGYITNPANFVTY